MPRKKNPSPGKKRRHPSNPGQRAVRQLPAGIPAWVPELKRWEEAKYDGIKGFPPEWVPEPHRKQFGSARGRLFFLVGEEKATYAEIQSRFDYLFQNKYGAMVLALAKDTKSYDDDLHRLVKLYQAIQLGPIEGLRRLAGDVAVAGFRVRTGHTRRKAARDKPEIQRIGKKYWRAHLKATVKDIQNCEEFKAYMEDKKSYADRTIQNWLREIDPRPLSSKRGPRSQNR